MGLFGKSKAEKVRRIWKISAPTINIKVSEQLCFI